jgi:hypothetical protein
LFSRLITKTWRTAAGGDVADMGDAAAGVGGVAAATTVTGRVQPTVRAEAIASAAAARTR